MAINWVGFRASPKAPKGSERREYTRVLEVHLPLIELFPLFTSAAGLTNWLDPVEAIEAKQGGAITFVSSAGEKTGGAFAQLNIPKRVLLVTESWGAVEIKVDARKTPVQMVVSFTRYLQPEDHELWLREVAARVATLNALVGGKIG